MPESKDAPDDRPLAVVAEVNLALLEYRKALKSVAASMGHASLLISAQPTDVIRDRDVTRLRELLRYEQAHVNSIANRLTSAALGIDW